MSHIRILSSLEISQIIKMSDAIQLMREAFIAISSGRASIPIRMHLPHGDDGESCTLLMPVYSEDHSQIVVKLVNLNPNNSEHELPLIHSLAVLSDAKTGAPLAVMNGESITSLRTGAGAGLATEILSRPDSSVLAIFGTGTQAYTQVDAICAVRPITQMIVFGRSSDSSDTFAKKVLDRHNIPAVKAKRPEELAEADIVCTATTSMTPVFSAKHLAPGAHVNGIGSYRPDMVEIPADVVANAKVVVDQREACLQEAGDLVQPIQHGDFDESHIHAELGEILLSNISGRTCDSEITLFKSVGNAIQDLVVANFIEKRAREMDFGKKMFI